MVGKVLLMLAALGLPYFHALEDGIDDLSSSNLELLVDILQNTTDDFRAIVEEKGSEILSKLEATSSGCKEEIEDLKMSCNLEDKAILLITTKVNEMQKKLIDLEKRLENTDAAAKIILKKSRAQLARNAERLKEKKIDVKIVGSSIYHYSATSDNKWHDAVATCYQHEMRLASFEDRAEMESVLDAAPKKEKGYWVSASNIGHKSGQFFWLDGTPVAEELWKKGQVLQATEEETCLVMHYKEGGILDPFNCKTASWYFVCEYEADT